MGTGEVQMALSKLVDGSLRVRTPPDPSSGETQRTLDLLDWVDGVTSQVPDALP